MSDGTHANPILGHAELEKLAQVLLFLLKVCIAASVDTEALCARFDRKGGILVGVACQFIILPFCGYGVANLLQMEPHYGMALMVIMTSPGGSYSNWWCALFNADLAMSVAMTGVSTIVGVIMLPANLALYCTLLYGRSTLGADHFTSVWWSLFIIVAALAVGLLISRFFNSEKARDRFNTGANFVGLTLFGLSLFVSHHQSRTPLWRKPPLLHAAIATPILGAIVITIVVSSLPVFRLSKPERVSVVIEACYQNPGLATSIVLGMFDGAEAGEAVSVPLIYGVYEALLLGLFCWGSYYFNWTLVKWNEQLTLREVLLGNFQERAAVPHSRQEAIQLQSSVEAPEE